MIEILKTFIKYILILIFSFILLFFSILLFRVFPFIKLYSGNSGNFYNLISTFFVHCFYYSFYNSLIISIFIFGVLILNYLKKFKYITFFIPLIITSVLVFTVIFIFKPNPKVLSFNRINDARIYFTQKNFISYNGSKYYFEGIEKDKIKNVIIIRNKNSYFYNDVKVRFLEDSLILQIGKEEISFIRSEFVNYRMQKIKFIDDFFIKFYNLPSRLMEQKNLTINILLWFSLAFFLLAFTILIKIIQYPLLSLIINFIFFFCFYFFFNFAFDVYQKIFMDLNVKIYLRDSILAVIFIILGVMFLSVNFIFINSKTDKD